MRNVLAMPMPPRKLRPPRAKGAGQAIEGATSARDCRPWQFRSSAAHHRGATTDYSCGPGPSDHAATAPTSRESRKKNRTSHRRSRQMTGCGGAVETSRRDCRRNRNSPPTTPSCRRNSRWMPPSSDAPYLLPSCRQRIHLNCRRWSHTMSPRTDQSSLHGHRRERQVRSW
jgi:hypothetical protein